MIFLVWILPGAMLLLLVFLTLSALRIVQQYELRSCTIRQTCPSRNQ
jgi:hypothetical protein